MYKTLIKNEIQKRGINNFVHFTHIDNLPSILQNGVLSIAELNRRGLTFHNMDVYRFDRRTDWISTSVTEINSKMFWQKCNENQLNPNDYVILFFDPEYIIDNTRYGFTTENASSREVANGNISGTYDSFLRMFNVDGKRNTLNDNQTTDVQAEVLVKSCIPVESIKRIAFRSYYTYCEFCRNNQHLFDAINEGIYFDYSKYAKVYFDTRKEAS